MSHQLAQNASNVPNQYHYDPNQKLNINLNNPKSLQYLSAILLTVYGKTAKENLKLSQVLAKLQAAQASQSLSNSQEASKQQWLGGVAQGLSSLGMSAANIGAGLHGMKKLNDLRSTVKGYDSKMSSLHNEIATLENPKRTYKAGEKPKTADEIKNQPELLAKKRELEEMSSKRSNAVSEIHQTINTMSSTIQALGTFGQFVTTTAKGGFDSNATFAQAEAHLSDGLFQASNSAKEGSVSTAQGLTNYDPNTVALAGARG